MSIGWASIAGVGSSFRVPSSSWEPHINNISRMSDGSVQEFLDSEVSADRDLRGGLFSDCRADSRVVPNLNRNAMSNVEPYAVTGGLIGSWMYSRRPLDHYEFNYDRGPAPLFQVGLFWRWMFRSHAFLLPHLHWLNMRNFFHLKPLVVCEDVDTDYSYNPSMLWRQEKRKMKASEDVEDIEEVKRLKTAHWTPPGQRPLAEPPVLPWSRILEDSYSDARLSALFPDDPEKRSRAKDLWGEILALGGYKEWVDDSRCWSGMILNARDKFYATLEDNVKKDYDEVYDEWRALYQAATRLGRFQYEHLDADGGSTNIEHLLRSGSLSLEEKGEEVKAKYGHLAPTGYDATRLGMFEYRLLGINNDTSRIEEELERGLGHLKEWQDVEIQKKYGHLILKVFEREYLDDDGGTTNIENLLRSGVGLLGADPAYDGPVEAKYRHLAPTGYDATPLGIFEYKWLESNDDTRHIETELKKGNNIFLDEAEEIRQKYRYLVSQYLDPVLEFERDYPRYVFRNRNPGQHLWDKLWWGKNICEGRDGKVMEKYGHLMSKYRPPKPTDDADKNGFESKTVARFENEYALSTHGPEQFEESLTDLLSQGQNIFEGWNGEVWERYGHLMAHYRPRDLTPYWHRKIRCPPCPTPSPKVILWKRHRAGCPCCARPMISITL